MRKFDVTGMSCAACSAHIEKAVSAVAGVRSCRVNLLTNSMTIDGDAGNEAIISAVEKAGYGASAEDKSFTEPKPEKNNKSGIAVRLTASIVLLLALMYVSMGFTMWSFPLPAFFTDTPAAVGLLEMLLSGAVMIINGRFFTSGVKGLLSGTPNMDTLVSLGSFSAFAYSVCIVFIMTASREPAKYLHSLYFESAAMILTLVSVGKLLEERSKARSTNAIKSLIKLAPQTATVLRDKKEEVIPLEKLVVGDIFTVRPGERIPADGEVTDGESDVDESALTGESMPVSKSAGNTVMSASFNKSGYLACRATRVGKDTTLSEIIRMVSDAAGQKAPVSRIADRVSAIFVPAVIIISLITLLVWFISGAELGFSLSCAICVLVISCPCALGLATPVAIMVGGGVGAKNGILFKSAAALEAAGKVKTVVLDKTGTVTKGEPVVTDIISYTDKAELCRIAGALEAKSEHPLAKAIMKYLEVTDFPQTAEFHVHGGGGVTALIEDNECAAGNLTFTKGFADVPKEATKLAAELAKAGKTPIFFTRKKTLIGVIAVTDEIKEDSAHAVSALKKLGIHAVMLTGDNKQTADAVAGAVGIDEVIAGVLPAEKEKVVERLTDMSKVAMVGDGINDAPALTRADVGIAIGAGSDIAIDSADVVLMKSHLSDVPTAISLSRATLRNIRENLFWAFIYNVICIPLAAGLWYPALGIRLNPMIGAAAMSASSICVVLNALRLNFFKADNNKNKKEKQKMEKTLKVSGMMCSHCEAAVKSALEALDGVESAAADHKAGNVRIKLTKNIDDAVLKKAITDKGYQV